MQPGSPSFEGGDQLECLRTALQKALVAMKLASALPGVADEYDFDPAIRSAMRALRGPE